MRCGFNVLKRTVAVGVLGVLFIITLLNSQWIFAQDPFLANGTRPNPPKMSKSYLRNHEFYIPYQLNNESDAQNPLNLYVSRDQGQTWELYKTLVPANETTNGIRQFNIRVGADGEYWFVIRPNLVENSPNPNFGVTADVKKIIVDTTPPVLKIESQRIDSENMTIYWTLADNNPDSNTVRFYQRFSESSDWTEVMLNRRATVPFSNQDGTSGATGQFTVQIPVGAAQLYLKGETLDMAKIPTVVLWNIPTAGSAANLPGTDRQDVPGMNGLNTGSYQSAFLNSESQPGAGNENQEGAASLLSNPDVQSDTLITDNSQLATNATETPATESAPTSEPSPQQWSPLRENPVETNAPATDNSQQAANNVANNAETVVNKPAVISPVQMNFAKTMIVNKPHFDLDYEVTAVGRSGVGSVELWAIRMDGKSANSGTVGGWFLLATDKDNITPITVDLKEDGIYGIKLVIKNGAGLGGEDPIPGEAPRQWIVLDRTAPTGELKSAEISVDSKIPQMRLRWACYDEFPNRTPVTLLWSRDGQEPWNPIANELPAVGEFLWVMPNDVPPRIVLKMEMTDKANNKNEFISRPVAADAFRPQGFIRNIHVSQ